MGFIMSRNDPDTRAAVEAAARLKQLLKDRGHHITAQEAEVMASSVVCEWIKHRTHHWAVRRGTPPFGDPDAMTQGFALAALGMIASKAGGLEWGKPLGDWTADDASLLFAIAYEAIEARRTHTLEDSDNPEDIGA
jgi:hypothetical protein